MIQDEENKNLELVEIDETKQILYSNQVNIAHTPYDIQFEFNAVVSMLRKELGIKNVASIVMSPQHAKQFYLLLQDHLKKYEKKYGALDLDLKIDESEK